MTRVGGQRLTLVGTLALALACGDAGNGLARETDFPCTLEFAPTGVVIRSDEQGRWPDPTVRLVRDSRGIFYTNSSTNGSLAIWSPDGQFLRTLGRMGEGPGEFMRGGGLNLWIIEGDTLLVRDNGFQWSFFSPDHQYVRRFREVGFVGLSPSTHLLDDGRLAGSAMSRLEADPVPSLRIVSRTGQIESDIGPLDSITRGRTTRTSSYAGGTSIWLGPPTETASPYVLEEWSLDNQLIRRIERVASWYDPASTIEGIAPTPSVRSIYVDSLGLILVLTTSRRPGIRPGTDTLPQNLRYYPAQYHVEVIDPRSMEVLASRDARPNEYPTLFPHGSRTGYRKITDSSGLEHFEIVRWQLSGSAAVCGERTRP